jgi:hypothetical protein
MKLGQFFPLGETQVAEAVVVHHCSVTLLKDAQTVPLPLSEQLQRTMPAGVKSQKYPGAWADASRLESIASEPNASSIATASIPLSILAMETSSVPCQDMTRRHQPLTLRAE